MATDQSCGDPKYPTPTGRVRRSATEMQGRQCRLTRISTARPKRSISLIIMTYRSQYPHHPTRENVYRPTPSSPGLRQTVNQTPLKNGAYPPRSLLCFDLQLRYSFRIDSEWVVGFPLLLGQFRSLSCGYHATCTCTMMWWKAAKFVYKKSVSSPIA